MSDEAKVKIGADIAELRTAINEATSVVKSGMDKMQSDMNASMANASGAGFTSMLSSMKASLAEVAAPLATFFGIFESGKKLIDVTREFDKIGAALLTTTKSADGAKVAFDAIEDFAAKTPYDLQQVATAFIKLNNLGLDPSERALTSYGNTASSMGKNLNQMIEAVADAATGEFERLKEFGIRADQHGEKVIFTFRGVKTEVGKSSKEIQDYLIKLGENNFAGAMTNRMNTLDGAMSNLGDSWDKLFRTISGQGIGDLIASMVRAATEALDWLSAKIKEVKEVWKSAMSDFTSSYAAGMGVDLDDGVSRVDQLRAAIAAAKQSLSEIHVGALGPSDVQLKAMGELNDKIKIFQHEIDQLEGRAANVPTIAGTPKKSVDRLGQFATPTGSDGWGDTKKKGQGGAGGDTRYQAWRAELEEMHEAEKDFFKASLSDDEKYWQAKLATVTGNGKHEQALRRQIEHELYNIHKQQAQQLRQLDEEELQAKRNAATYEVDIAKENLQAQFDLGQITERQRLEHERSLAAQQYNIERELLNKKMLLYQEDVVAVSKFQEQKAELERRFAVQVQQINNNILRDQKKNIDSMLEPISSAISTSVQGLILMTTTWKKALSNLFTAILGEFVSLVSKMVLRWAAGEIMKTNLTKQGSVLRTMLEKTGLIETATTKQTTDDIATASTLKRTATELPEVAQVAGGKAAESVSAIPYVGPALAAAAFAATVAMIMSSRGHAVGSWSVPGDMVTKVHAGEMIVPEQFAKNVREGGALGGGGGTINLHVHAADAASVRRLFKNNGAALAETLRRQARNFTPLKV